MYWYESVIFFCAVSDILCVLNCEGQAWVDSCGHKGRLGQRQKQRLFRACYSESQPLSLALVETQGLAGEWESFREKLAGSPCALIGGCWPGKLQAVQ